MRRRNDGPLADRFWVRVDKGDGSGCWLWTGYKWRGYGRYNNTETRSAYVHRISYELLVGPIPDGLTIDHLCRVPACVRPDHLEPVTAAENLRRAAIANAKSECPRGHAYVGANDRINPRGDRMCPECNRQRARVNKAKARALREAAQAEAAAA